MAKISYKFKKLPEGDEKLPNQAVIVLKTLKALGGDENKFVSREELVAELDKVDGDRPNKLNARQPVERVVMFYQKHLVDNGYLEMNKEQAEKKEPKKDAKGKSDAPQKSKVPSADPAQAEKTAESVAI